MIYNLAIFYIKLTPHIVKIHEITLKVEGSKYADILKALEDERSKSDIRNMIENVDKFYLTPDFLSNFEYEEK